MPAPEVRDDTNLSVQRRKWAQGSLDEETRRWLAEDNRYFLHQALSTPCLNVVARCEGIYIEDLGGRRYMDFHGNNVHHIGYGHPKLREALKHQLDDLTFSPRRYANRPAVELARKLAAITPGDLDRCLFAPSGSDAVEIALRLARAYTGRYKTVSFWDAFHGAGFGASSIGGEAMFRSGPAGPLLPGASHVPPPYCFRCPFGHADRHTPGSEECCLVSAHLIRYVLETEGDVGAVIASPIRGVTAIPPRGFWQEVRRACDEHGALLIFDEIPYGLGKTGKMFSCQHYDVVPDILVTGKALGGGIVPIACVSARPELNVVGGYAIGHYTHEKNPVLAAAALATLTIIEEEGLVANAAEVGAFGLELARDLQARHRLVGEVRGKGLVIGIELVVDRQSRAPARAAAEAVLYKALERGLSFKGVFP